MRFAPVPLELRAAFLGSILPLGLVFLPDCGGGSTAAPPDSTQPASPTYLQMTADGITTLQSNWYNQQTGLWNTTGWWNCANALTVLINYSKLSKSNQYLSNVANTYALNSSGGFLNQYYDKAVCRCSPATICDDSSD